MQVTFETEQFQARDGSQRDLWQAVNQTVKHLGNFQVGRHGGCTLGLDRVYFLLWEDARGREFWLAYDPHADRVMAFRPLRMTRYEVLCRIWEDRLDRWFGWIFGVSKQEVDNFAALCHENARQEIEANRRLEFNRRDDYEH
ncbi:MAG: hypothetical protein IT204_26245 [Fimbriimonadaceae bacterium]|nr:hypothetical protein [Fimbriimonadaceae bacterium]